MNNNNYKIYFFAEAQAPGSGYGLADPDHIRAPLRRGQVPEWQGVSEQDDASIEEEDETPGPEVHAVPDERGR